MKEGEGATSRGNLRGCVYQAVLSPISLSLLFGGCQGPSPLSSPHQPSALSPLLLYSYCLDISLCHSNPFQHDCDFLQSEASFIFLALPCSANSKPGSPQMPTELVPEKAFSKLTFPLSHCLTHSTNSIQCLTFPSGDKTLGQLLTMS